MVSMDRSGIVSGYRLIYAGVPYVMTGKYVERLQQDDAGIAIETLPQRPINSDTTSLLVYFPGGIGDVISLKPVLEEFKYQRPEVEVAVVSTMRDQCLIGDVVGLWDYPVSETVANQYDAWVNIAEFDRASVGQELVKSFAEYLGIEPPKWGPMLSPDFGIARAMQGYIRDWKRPKIGIHMDSACHFRSIPHMLGGVITFGLVEHGCDCYILGGPTDYFPFRENGQYAEPEHIFDMVPYVGPIEHYMAFIEHMDVILTCDTMAMHIAGAMGKDTLALFGMTRGDARTGYYPSVSYIQGEAECAPCERIWQDVTCPHEHCLALGSIDPEQVVERILEMHYEQANDHCLIPQA